MWPRAFASPSAALWRRAAARAARIVPLPGQCEICRRWGDARLCSDCRQRFAPPRPRCARCGLATGAALAACGECLRQPPPFARTVLAFDYAFPWDGLIARWKFSARPELSGALAAPLAEAVQSDLAARAEHAAPPPALVLPVPLAPSRLAERGFNQAWEIARRVARAVALPARADVLQRALATAHQAGLARAERERNLRAAFMVPPVQRAALQGRPVALVDDVLTTGATAREAAAALLRAGAASVELWVLARTPAPGEGD